MFCNKCGAPINEGEKFCSSCGAIVENAAQTQQITQEQQPHAQQPYYPYDMPAPKKSKKFLWIGIAAVAVLALAAVLIFVVFARAGSGLLSGNTTQTAFVNDNVKVFTGAFSGLSNGTFERMLNEPFDLSMDLTNDTNGQKYTATIDAAYDKEALGLSTESNGYATKLLLLGDTLYTETYGGYVSGLEFDTDADLDKPMTLTERIKALTEGLSQAAGEIDYKKIAEMFVNSIDEKCFNKSGSKTTLTLDIDDIIDTLKNFSKKLEADKELVKDINDYAEQFSDTNISVLDALDTAVSSLESAKDYIDFELVWEISYENGEPVSMDISFDGGSDYSRFEVMFGYEKDGADTDITFEFTTPSGYSDLGGELSYSKTASGIEYSGSITASGQKVSIDGSEEWSGNDTHGEINISTPYGGESSIEYDETLTFGMPSKNVEKDQRFEVDTSNAYITKIGQIFDLFFNPVAAFNPITPAQPAVSEAPMASVTPAAAEGTKLVGISLPTKLLQRWNQDSTGAELEAMGYMVDVQYADNDPAIQVQQIENQIAMGCDVLVIVAVDGSALNEVLSKADAAGIPVIAYDRLLNYTDKCDYYVTYSLYDIGRVQAEYIVNTLGLNSGAAGPFTLECFAGDQGDISAHLFYQGAIDALQPYIDGGVLVVKSGETSMEEICIQNWNGTVAQERMNGLLTQNYANDSVDAILSPNDSLAQGIVAALEEDGYGTSSKPFPILTGQDCDRASIKNIIQGKQSMSVFRDPRVLSHQTAVMVDALLSGKEVPINATFDNGSITVPAFCCEIIYADASNYSELLIDTGYYSEADILN